MIELRTFVLKKEDFILNLGKKENLKNSKKELLSEKGNRVLKLS